MTRFPRWAGRMSAAGARGGARPIALVTGGSGGIGLELARVLARERHDLVLVARGEAALETAAVELRAGGAAVHVLPADLSRRAAPRELAAAVAALGLEVDVLVNNAGFALWGPFVEADLERQRDLLDLNVGALTDLTYLFVKPMLARGRGRILNVASTAAFQPGPGAAAYYASKACVLSLSVALAVELEGTGVTVTALCPGPTRTGFAARAGATGSRLFMRDRGGDPRAVARAGYAAMTAGRTVCVPGAMNGLGAFATRFVPRRLAARVVERINAAPVS